MSQGKKRNRVRLNQAEIEAEIALEAPTSEEIDRQLIEDEFGPSGRSIFDGRALEEVFADANMEFSFEDFEDREYHPYPYDWDEYSPTY